MKQCFTCKRNLPLFLYHRDDSKYKRESNKGKCIECRFCALKRIKIEKEIKQRKRLKKAKKELFTDDRPKYYTSL